MSTLRFAPHIPISVRQRLRGCFESIDQGGWRRNYPKLAAKDAADAKQYILSLAEKAYPGTHMSKHSKIPAMVKEALTNPLISDEALEETITLIRERIAMRKVLGNVKFQKHVPLKVMQTLNQAFLDLEYHGLMQDQGTGDAVATAEKAATTAKQYIADLAAKAYKSRDQAR